MFDLELTGEVIRKLELTEEVIRKLVFAGKSAVNLVVTTVCSGPDSI